MLGMATSAYAVDVGGTRSGSGILRARRAPSCSSMRARSWRHRSAKISFNRAPEGCWHCFSARACCRARSKFFAALGDIDAVRAALDENGDDPAPVNEAFVRACLFEHEAIAALLLQRSIALDSELGAKVDGGVGRPAFIRCFVETRANHIPKIGGGARTVGLWKTFVIEQVSRSVQGDDVTAFVASLRREPWLLADECVDLQNELMGCGRAEFITALLDLDPAILRRPPRSDNIEYALVDAKAHLIPLLTRIWPVPDDLPMRREWATSCG